jgi:L-aspartate oxidase
MNNLPNQANTNTTTENLFDVLIVGGGLAGLSAAIRLAQTHKVCLLYKTPKPAGASFWAQGGIAVPIDPEDSIELHIQDTLKAGAGLCNVNSVKFVIENAIAQLDWLLAQGVELTRNADNNLHLTKEGGHSIKRIVHANDATGFAIQKCLQNIVENHPNICIKNNYIAIDLITEEPKNTYFCSKKCYGVYALNQDTQHIDFFVAKATILATGGASRAYLYSTNPEVASGDGIAMGWRAGAEISNLEFNQFHPTCLYHLQSRTFLLTEALRGEGAKLKLADGSEFMHQYHELAELAPRDIVARAIDAEMKKNGLDCVYLDIRHKGDAFIQSHFPNIYKHCLSVGLDLSKHMIPVVPAAHYTCGGLKTDLHAQTNIQGLYAIGEVAYTGLHGANRIASNSLLECLVFSQSASQHIINNILNVDTKAVAIPKFAYNQVALFSLHKKPHEDTLLTIAHNWNYLRNTMWDYVGIVRTQNRLNKAIRRIKMLQEEIEDLFNKVPLSTDLLELRNLVQVAMLIVESALERKESRGLHYNLDYIDKLPQAIDSYMVKS